MDAEKPRQLYVCVRTIPGSSVIVEKGPLTPDELQDKLDTGWVIYKMEEKTE